MWDVEVTESRDEERGGVEGQSNQTEAASTLLSSHTAFQWKQLHQTLHICLYV